MTSAAFLELKQKVTRLKESQRKNLSVHIIRLGQKRPVWKRETTRRLNEMEAGQKISVAELKKQLGHV